MNDEVDPSPIAQNKKLTIVCSLDIHQNVLFLIEKTIRELAQRSFYRKLCSLERH